MVYLGHSLSTWFTYSLISLLFRLGTALAYQTRGGNPRSPSPIGGYFRSYLLDNTILIILCDFNKHPLILSFVYILGL